MSTKRIDQIPQLPTNEEVQEEDKLLFWQTLNSKTIQASWGRFVKALFKRKALRVNDQGSTSEVPANHYGLEVDRGGNNPYIVWDDTHGTNGQWMVRGAGGDAMPIGANEDALLKNEDTTITAKYTIQNQLDIAGRTTMGEAVSTGNMQVAIGKSPNLFAPFSVRVDADINKESHIQIQDLHHKAGNTGNQYGPALEFRTNYRVARIDGLDQRTDNSDTVAKGALLFKTAFQTENEAPYGYAERMRINHEGNVGIGTHAPSERLEVEGNIKATGSLIVEDALQAP
ncbi:MAG: hypothetical protein AAFQ98_23305, partial [Bacteroidota bacterium]